MQNKTLQTIGVTGGLTYDAGETVSEQLLADTALSGTVTIVDFRTAGLTAAAQGTRSLDNSRFVLRSVTTGNTAVIRYALIGTDKFYDGAGTAITATGACTRTGSTVWYTVPVSNVQGFVAGQRISVFKNTASNDEYLRGILMSVDQADTTNAGTLLIYALDATGFASIGSGNFIGGWYGWGAIAEAACNLFQPLTMAGNEYGGILLRPNTDFPRLALYSTGTAHAEVSQIN